MSSKMQGPGFYEFLIEAELQQYYNAFKNELKVQNVAQLKYVSEDDMSQIGMSRPEMRRLTKYFHKHCPQTYLAKMKKKLLSRREDNMSIGSLTSGSQTLPGGRSGRVVAPGRHIIQADAIVSHKTLGSGEFGTVQQGVWTSDDGERIQVAIKCLSQERMENNPVEFLKEAAIMHTVDHEHIVRLYGVVLDTSSLTLVTELAPLRSLLECLKEPSMRPNLSLPTLFDFSIQICDGMQYLESNRLIHRDLAARNILVFSRTKVKISDFGLSRALGVGKDYYQTNFNMNLKLPIAWCAPECINFLKFTSFSDVWAYGVTLWEMFSYGFQPWAALTGQQILEAIDEPNYQRLEKPECCPTDIYYQIMLKTWQHDPLNRPTFAQLLNLLPESKPEQVQSIRDTSNSSTGRREMLSFETGELITVLDKKPLVSSNASTPGTGLGHQGNDETNSGPILWKGVLKCGKSGLFNPANTIAYLGPSLPTVGKKDQGKTGPFNRNDSKSSSMRKGKLSVDMISSPQETTFTHTGHVGSDGVCFGDMGFLNSKCWVPRQVVPPYKHDSSSVGTGGSHSSEPSASSAFGNNSKHHHRRGDSIDLPSNGNISDTAPLLPSTNSTATTTPTENWASNSSNSKTRSLNKKTDLRVQVPLPDNSSDHEYHEISSSDDESGKDVRLLSGGSSATSHKRHANGGLTNPALSSRSDSPLESPRFEQAFDLGTGPSLVEEVFGALVGQRNKQEEETQLPDEANVKNELREMARQKKKFATVKPISSSDRKTMDHAIAIANELASRSMLELDRVHGKSSYGGYGYGPNSMDELSSPRTPNSPTSSRSKKFLFPLLGKGSHNDRGASERRNYSQEAASIPDIQSTLTEEAKEAYNSLIEKPSSIGSLGFLTPSFDNKTATFTFPDKCSQKKSDFFDTETLNAPLPTGPVTLRRAPPLNSNHRGRALSTPENGPVEDPEDSNPLRMLRNMNRVSNVLPLPPRDRKNLPGSRSFDSSTSNSSSQSSVRHHRKYPLLIPGKITIDNLQKIPLPQVPSFPQAGASTNPPPPPPKPQRQLIKQVAEPETPVVDKVAAPEPPPRVIEPATSDCEGKGSSVVKLCENYESDEVQPLKDEISNEIIEKVLEEASETLEATSISTLELTPHQVTDSEPLEACSVGEPLQRPVPTKRRNSSETTVSHENKVNGTVVDQPLSNGIVSQPIETAKPHQEQSKPTNENGRVKVDEELSVEEVDPIKIRTVQRILGPTTSSKDCSWALSKTLGDAAHAVKLLRLKALLPDSILHGDIERVISVLEMSHWDVARAHSFLTANSNNSFTSSSLRNSGRRSKLYLLRSDSNSSSSSTSRSDYYSNNNTPHNNDDVVNSNSTNPSDPNLPNRDYIRPTRV